MEELRAEWRSYILVEPALLFWMFGQVASGNIFPDLVIYSKCKGLMGSEWAQNCSILHDNSTSQAAIDLQHMVQHEVKITMMLKTTFDNLIPAIVSLFVGTWSDKYGRKPILLVGYLGSMLSWGAMALMSTLDIHTTELYLLAYIPYMFCGGFCGIFIGTLSYISDITDNARRPIHMIGFEVVLALASIIGNLACPSIFNALGYSAVYGVSAIAGLISLIYIKFVTPETIPSTEKGSLNKEFCMSVAKESYKVVTKARRGFKRDIVWYCIIIIVIIQILLAGESGIIFMFTSAKLGWNLWDFSKYNIECLILVTIWNLLGSKILHNCLHLTETTVLMITCVFMFANRIVLSLTFLDWHMDLAIVLSIFNGMLSPMVRSILTKSVPPEDVGKAFSMTMFIEILVTALVAGEIYQIVYETFHDTYPCPVWLVSALFIAIIKGITLLIHCILKGEASPQIETGSIK